MILLNLLLAISCAFVFKYRTEGKNLEIKLESNEKQYIIENLMDCSLTEKELNDKTIAKSLADNILQLKALNNDLSVRPINHNIMNLKKFEDLSDLIKKDKMEELKNLELKELNDLTRIEEFFINTTPTQEYKKCIRIPIGDGEKEKIVQLFIIDENDVFKARKLNMYFSNTSNILRLKENYDISISVEIENRTGTDVLKIETIELSAPLTTDNMSKKEWLTPVECSSVLVKLIPVSKAYLDKKLKKERNAKITKMCVLFFGIGLLVVSACFMARMMSRSYKNRKIVL